MRSASVLLAPLGGAGAARSKSFGQVVVPVVPGRVAMIRHEPCARLSAPPTRSGQTQPAQSLMDSQSPRISGRLRTGRPVRRCAEWRRYASCGAHRVRRSAAWCPLAGRLEIRARIRKLARNSGNWPTRAGNSPGGSEIAKNYRIFCVRSGKFTQGFLSPVRTHRRRRHPSEGTSVGQRPAHNRRRGFPNRPRRPPGASGQEVCAYAAVSFACESGYLIAGCAWTILAIAQMKPTISRAIASRSAGRGDRSGPWSASADTPGSSRARRDRSGHGAAESPADADGPCRAPAAPWPAPAPCPQLPVTISDAIAGLGTCL